MVYSPLSRRNAFARNSRTVRSWKPPSCLGGRGLLATKSLIEENITEKLDRHFSTMGAFQGGLNPLSSKSIIDSCVVPVLLFSCENWLCPIHVCTHWRNSLELAKRALKWLIHFSNTSAILALEMETMRSRLASRKLSLRTVLLVLGLLSWCWISLSREESRELESYCGRIFFKYSPCRC